MNDEIDSPDPRLTRLRTLVARVEREVDDLEARPGGKDAGSLRSAWVLLVKALALGVEPLLRSCPSCARAIVFEATRCRYCWARSDAT